MNAAMPAQACQMNSFIGGQQLNGAFFNIGDSLAIVIFAPFFENVLYPGWAKLQRKDVSLGQKLMLGLAVAGASNVAAAILEASRRAAPLMKHSAYTECGPKHTYMNDISAFWMFIPFTLVGFGEILVMPSMYFYAYKAAPPKVRATIQAFNLVAQGCISGAFTGALQLAFMPNDINTGNLNIYYYVNIASALLGIVLYVAFRCHAGSSRIFAQPPAFQSSFAQLAESTSSFRHSEVQSFSLHPTRTS
jgi:dipeptide/tripeptide permease